MPGPAPKDSATRRRRNAPQGGEWIDVPPLERPVLGCLPRRAKGEGRWPARTRELWEAWRLDAVTALWGPSDVALAVDLAYLHAEMVRTSKVTLASEFRHRVDGLGLSPKGRRDLRWRLVPNEAAPVVALRPARVDARVDDRRTRLQAVDPALAEEHTAGARIKELRERAASAERPGA